MPEDEIRRNVEPNCSPALHLISSEGKARCRERVAPFSTAHRRAPSLSIPCLPPSAHRGYTLPSPPLLLQHLLQHLPLPPPRQHLPPPLLRILLRRLRHRSEARCQHLPQPRIRPRPRLLTPTPEVVATAVAVRRRWPATMAIAPRGNHRPPALHLQAVVEDDKSTTDVTGTTIGRMTRPTTTILSTWRRTVRTTVRPVRRKPS